MSISTSVDEKTMEQIDALAARSGLTRGGWARAALTEAAAESACYTKTVTRTNAISTSDQGKAPTPDHAGAKTLRPSENFDSSPSIAMNKNSLKTG